MGGSDAHLSFFAHLSHLDPSGGDFKASRRNCIYPQYTHYLYMLYMMQVAKVPGGGHGPGSGGREVDAGAVPQDLHQRVLLQVNLGPDGIFCVLDNIILQAVIRMVFLK